MESLKHLAIIVLLFSTTVFKALSYEGENAADSARMNNDFSTSDTEETQTLRGLSRILAQKIPQNYTCDKLPGVCRLKGSPGPDCCKKKCVDVKTDGLHCGMCGYKCRYNEICCKKKCVNARFDRKNCGGCGIKCKKGDVCAFGMCSYA